MPKQIENIDIGLVEPEEFVDAARAAGAFVFDLETTGLDPKNDRIEGLALYVPPTDAVSRLGDLVRTKEDRPEMRAWYPFFDDSMKMWVQPDETIEEQAARLKYERTRDEADKLAWKKLRQKPVMQNLRPPMDQRDIMNRLRPLFENSPGTIAVAHNAKFDTAFLRFSSGTERGYWQYGGPLHRTEEEWEPMGGIRLADSMLADFLVDENFYAYGLKGRVKDLFGHEMKTYTEVTRNKRQGMFSFMADQIEALGTYAMEDCYWTWCLFEDRMKRLQEMTPGDDHRTGMGNLERIYWGIDMKIARIIEEMETTGILIDWRWLKKVTVELEENKEKILDEIQNRIGWMVNPNSAPQVSTLLFGPKEAGCLGLPTKGIKRGKTGQYSTGSKEIAHLSRVDPVVKLLLDWRSADTIQANFSVKLAELAQESTSGKIHSRFNQTGTKIFRLSSSDPVNLQNQPRKKNLIRKAFCSVHLDNLAEGMLPDELLYGADYGQVELRVAAHLSGDEGMIEVYNMVGGCNAEGGLPCKRYLHWACDECGHLWIPTRDQHPEAANEPDDSWLDWLGSENHETRLPHGQCPGCKDHHIEHQRRCRHVDLHQRTAEEVEVPRNPLAKNLNFGSLYRIGPFRFCQYADLFDEKGEARIDYAREVLDGWYKAYPAIPAFHDRTEKALHDNKWIAYTITGRQRRLARERYKNEYRAVTQGIQFQVSGSAQDILKVAMGRIWEEKERRANWCPPAERKLWRRTRFVIQVHDEIILIGPSALEAEIKHLIKTKMEGAAKLRVPLTADCKSGPTWDHIH